MSAPAVMVPPALMPACADLLEEVSPWEPEHETDPGRSAFSLALVEVSAGLATAAWLAGAPADAHAGAKTSGPATWSDVGSFTSEMSRVFGAEQGLPLDALARGLATSVDDARAAAPSRFDFDIDMPTLGLLQGRVSIANGQADLELRACRPSSAVVLRSRQSELQRLIDREAGGDVSLFIV